MDIELFNQYKKLGRGSWGKDLTLWKTMYTAFLNPLKNEELTPFNEMLLNIFLDIPKARKEGKPIIMHPFNFEPELFFAMNLEPLMQEVISVGLAPFNLNQPFIDFVNKVGYGDNLTICNAQRPFISLTLQGAAPIPDLLFYLSTPCNSLSMSYQVFQNLTNVPSFNLDIPYWAYNQEDDYYDRKTVDYIINQIKNCINWLENNTSLKFEEENFKKTMDLCNQARGYVLEFNELLKAVPCPVTSQTGFGNFLTMVTRGGTSDAVKVTKYMRDAAAQNVKNKIGGIPDEKIRIAWPYTHVFFDQTLLSWIENSFNAVVIMDLLGHYKVLPHDISTIANCYKSLGEGILDASMVGKCRGPIEYYIDYLIKYIKDYKIDCVIMPMHFACKHVSIMGQVTSEAIKEEIGIPTLIFGCDSYDSREVTSEMIRGKISEFISQVVN
ncbi:MAG: 2-hydroxyacyl-CoA dehydratase subunit D [Promethearchaeota archaeon]|jgi:benzoyl-CoA reductase/2-hydroxyglutaryl-CoA dehydratase subunit BcrC/BadD/HgdB